MSGPTGPWLTGPWSTATAVSMSDIRATALEEAAEIVWKQAEHHLAEIRRATARRDTLSMREHSRHWNELMTIAGDIRAKKRGDL